MSDEACSVSTTAPTSLQPSSSALIKPATDQQLRSRFLNMIGIESKLPACSVLTKPTQSPSPYCPNMGQSGLESDSSSASSSMLPPSNSSTEESSTCIQQSQQNQGHEDPQPMSHAFVHPRTKVARYTETLKYDKLADKYYAAKRRKINDGDPLISSTQSPSSQQPRKPSNRKSKPERRLNFNETVEVVPIPMRNEYSNRVKSRLWSNAMEIHENAARNTVEFASEGWDWRKVTEDERMYVCVATGELIHPCHYDPNFEPDPI
jgi:hypothetical protein